MTPRQRAEKLALELFANGSGQRATNLVLIDNDCIDRHRELGGWAIGPFTDRIEAAMIEALADQEEPTEEQIAIEAAKARIVGEAIKHYEQHALAASRALMIVRCDICEAVQALELLVPMGNLEALGLALTGGTRDGDQEARA